MNRDEWDACEDPLVMLDWLRERGRLAGRKERLLACAVVQRFGWFFVYLCRDTTAHLNFWERHADGEAGADLPLDDATPLSLHSDHRQGATLVLDALGSEQEAARDVILSIRSWLSDRIEGKQGMHWPITGPEYLREQTLAQAALIRDLFGDLFHPDPQWAERLANRDEVVRLASAIYRDRAFADLAVLADALEEGGCRDAEVLAHCRGGGEHARGCWVVDAILGL